MRKAYTVWVRKHDGKTKLGRPKSRWENNIELHREETGREGVF
jgi:hypothetical protein